MPTPVPLTKDAIPVGQDFLMLCSVNMDAADKAAARQLLLEAGFNPAQFALETYQDLNVARETIDLGKLYDAWGLDHDETWAARRAPQRRDNFSYVDGGDPIPAVTEQPSTPPK